MGRLGVCHEGLPSNVPIPDVVSVYPGGRGRGTDPAASSASGALSTRHAPDRLPEFASIAREAE